MRMRWFTILALALAVGLATAASPFASASPDGLERVAADKAFLDQGRVAQVQERAPVRTTPCPASPTRASPPGSPASPARSSCSCSATASAAVVRR